MRITDIKVEEITSPLITPFKTALRTVNNIQDIMVKIYTDVGCIGYGEAAPTAAITGETLSSIKSVIIDYIRPLIIGIDIEEIDLIFKKINNSIVKNYSAKAAVDIAIYDLFAQNLNKPLYKILGGSKNTLITDITISLNDTKEMVNDSIIAVKNGYEILKIKVGNDYKKDIERISEISKAVGDDILLRIDANQGWNVKNALKIISKLELLDLNIQFIEQPVIASDIEGLKFITNNTKYKILADESVFSVIDAINIIQNKCADIINIKLMKTGGIYNALKIINIAETYGVECMMGCMLENKISVTAAAHLAAAKSVVTMIDLDGPNLCSVEIIKGGAEFNNSNIIINNTCGLGFSNL